MTQQSLIPAPSGQASPFIFNRSSKIGKPGVPPKPADAWAVMSKRPVPGNIYRPKKPAILPSNTVPGPASIAELARALKNDVDLIYEWVYSNVDFFPVWGVHKGALGTLIDRVGGSFEQASLMVALLTAAGYTANFVAGTIRLTAAQIEQLLGTDDSVVATASEQFFQFGQIPYAATYSSGVLQYIDFDHIWVQVNIGGTNYVFDPSFKTYSYTTGIDLGPIIGFNEATLTSDVQSGATISPAADSIQNFNTGNLHTDFKAYGTSVLNWIKTNNFAAKMDDIIGGRTIQPLPVGLQLRQTALPYQSPGFSTTIWSSIPDQYRATYEVAFFDQNNNQLFYAGFFSDDIYSRRLTITFNAANQPQLNLDGSIIVTGSSAVTLDQTYQVGFAVNHPFFDPFADNTWFQSIYAPGTYLLGNCWLSTRQSMVDYHRSILNQNVAAGTSSADESVLGESLEVLWFMHRAQGNKVEDIYDWLGDTTQFWYHFGGIAGYNSLQQAPYFDLVGGSKSLVSRSGDTTAADNVFTATDFIVNAFEAGIMQQNFAATGVNTQRMLETANAAHQTIFDATSGNWTSGTDVRGKLVNWDDYLSTLDTSISNGDRLIIHENGLTQVQNYVGGGWNQLAGTGVSGLLTGHIQGGAPGEAQNTDQTAASGQGGAGTTDTGNAGQGSQPGSNEPIGLFSGNYYYNRADLRVGSGGFPYSLEFSRHYNSTNRYSDGPLGLGWSHNFETSIAVGSNGMRGIGEVSPKEAAAVIAHAYVMLQLQPDNSPSLTTVLICTLSSLWLMDQITNNAATLNDIAQSRTFVKLIDGTFNPPPGYADVLVQNGDGSFTYKNPHQETWQFDATGKLNTYSSPAGMTRTYQYDVTSGNLLTVTTANPAQGFVGRTLTFNYTGSRLSSVSDGTGRSISFVVDANANLTTFTDANGKSITYQYAQPGLLSKVFLAANPATPVVTNTFDTLGRVMSQQSADTGVYNYYFAGSRSEEVDPAGNRHIMYFNSVGSLARDINALGQETDYQRDGLNRLVQKTLPEGNAFQWAYDNNNNVVSKTWIAKPGSGLANVVQSFTYDPAWNKVKTATDALSNATTYSYDPTQGTLLSIARPQVNGQTPTVAFTYNSRGQVLTRTDETSIVDSFAYDSTTEILLSRTRDSGTGRLNLTTSYGYDAVGNRNSVTDPRGNTTSFVYDNERRLTQRTDAAPFGYLTNFQYNDSGWRTSVQRQTSDPLHPWQIFGYAYTPGGRLLTVTDPANNVFTYGYDTVGRVVSKTDAENRVWQFSYDAVSRVSTVTDPLSNTAETRTYTVNGWLATTKDANGNVSTFQFDGFDRPSKRVYADTTFEQFTFDANSNLLTQQTRKGDTLTNSYDPLNRLATRQPGALPLQTWSYDLAGRLTKINTPTNPSDPTTGDYQFFYDTAGRLSQQRTPAAQNVTYQLDGNGNLSQLTWPDGYFVTYSLDALNRLTDIKLNGSASAALHFDYDALSRRIDLVYQNGCTCNYTYQLNNDLSEIAQSFVGSQVFLDYSYNKVHQAESFVMSDFSFVWMPPGAGSITYSPANDLNEYTAVAALTYQYDQNGCLTNDGVNSYSYDVLSRLVQVSDTAVVNSYLYDPQNRQEQKSVNNQTSVVTTNYLYDGKRLIAEYDGSGNLLNRYVRGAGNDEVLIQISASGALTFLHHDRLGSIIAQTDSTGAVINKYQYSAFGETPSLTGSIFGFTGQKYDAEFSLYNFKARYYNPAIGRFLQPDPLSYNAGDLNLYTYTGNDAVNRVDTNGTQFGLPFMPPAPPPTPLPGHPPAPPPSPPTGFPPAPPPSPPTGFPPAPPPVNGGRTGPCGGQPGGKDKIPGSPVFSLPQPGDPDFIGPVKPGQGSGQGDNGGDNPQPPEDPQPTDEDRERLRQQQEQNNLENRVADELLSHILNGDISLDSPFISQDLRQLIIDRAMSQYGIDLTKFK